MTQPNLSRDAASYPVIFKCSTPNCYWRTAHADEHSAQHTRLKHKAETCPLSGESKVGKIGTIVGQTILEEFWAALDDVIKTIQETPDEDKQSEAYRLARGNAIGIARCISIANKVHWAGENKVLKWAIARYGMAHRGHEWQPTPGVDGFNPMPAPTQAEVKQRRPAARREAAPVAAAPSGDEALKSLPKQKRDMAEMAINNGYSDEQVHALTKIEMPVIEALRKKLGK